MTTCVDKHKAMRNQIITLTTFLVLMMTGVVWAVKAGFDAKCEAWAVQKQAEDTQADLDKHKAVQDERDKHMVESLRRIEKGMEEVKNDLKHKHDGD